VARPSLKSLVSKITFTKRLIRESQTFLKRSTKQTQNEQPLFIEAVQLKAGKSFGELALIKNKPRAATIKCLEDCHFAVMSQADYNKVLNKIEQKNMTRIVEFLHELPFFKVWTR
jgi:CRP-like cAMP-binding protein